MSGNAAKEITDMLAASIFKVEGIVRNTQEKVETLVKSGKEKSNPEWSELGNALMC